MVEVDGKCLTAIVHSPTYKRYSTWMSWPMKNIPTILFAFYTNSGRRALVPRALDLRPKINDDGFSQNALVRGRTRSRNTCVAYITMNFTLARLNRRNVLSQWNGDNVENQ